MDVVDVEANRCHSKSDKNLALKHLKQLILPQKWKYAEREREMWRHHVGA